MKILSIVWYKVLPPIYGGQKGIALFNKYLSAHGELTCLCSADNERRMSGFDKLSLTSAKLSPTYKLRPELPIGKKQFLSPTCWNLIRRVANEEQATHIILEHPYHGIAAVKASRASGAKLIVHSHNIESERFRHLGKRGWKLLAHYEKWVHRKADLSIFKTARDMDFAIRNFGLKESACHVVPYGIETRSEKLEIRASTSDLIRKRHGIAANEKILLFAGTLDYSPNATAVTAIFQKIAPALQALNFPFKILICGRNKLAPFQYLHKLRHPAVSLLSEVDDMENYFSAADVFINPVAEGGGIQTKTIEALAQHCNVVGFDHMLDKSVVKYANEKVYSVLRGDWSCFVEKIIEASDNKLYTPDSFFHHFSWERITGELAERIGRI